MNTNTKLNRRAVLSLGVAASAAAAVPYASAQQSDVQPIRPEPKRGARQDLELVRSFVGAGHKDANIAQVKELLDRDPKLVFASHDWGEGDWETALGGASHTGSREMARYLLSRGARIDSFCAAMLAERDVLAALVAANPSVATSRGPHGYTLLYHVATGGDVVMADLLKPHLGTQPRSYTQALSAAVRDGHLAMTKWLFEHGDVDPNIEDALGRRPLSLAIAKGFQSVADELRKHGARESG
jgi:ankyrin repeat protein